MVLLNEVGVKMARSGGFEPPTAWFVARYSIQLSYERTIVTLKIMAVREGFEPSIRLQTVYSLSRGAPSAARPPHQNSGVYVTDITPKCKCFFAAIRAENDSHFQFKWSV